MLNLKRVKGFKVFVFVLIQLFLLNTISFAFVMDQEQRALTEGNQTEDAELQSSQTQPAVTVYSGISSQGLPETNTSIANTTAEVVDPVSVVDAMGDSPISSKATFLKASGTTVEKAVTILAQQDYSSEEISAELVNAGYNQLEVKAVQTTAEETPVVEATAEEATAVEATAGAGGAIKIIVNLDSAGSVVSVGLPVGTTLSENVVDGIIDGVIADGSIPSGVNGFELVVDGATNEIIAIGLPSEADTNMNNVNIIVELPPESKLIEIGSLGFAKVGFNQEILDAIPATLENTEAYLDEVWNIDAEYPETIIIMDKEHSSGHGSTWEMSAEAPMEHYSSKVIQWSMPEMTYFGVESISEYILYDYCVVNGLENELTESANSADLKILFMSEFDGLRGDDVISGTASLKTVANNWHALSYSLMDYRNTLGDSESAILEFNQAISDTFDGLSLLCAENSDLTDLDFAQALYSNLAANEKVDAQVLATCFKDHNFTL